MYDSPSEMNESPRDMDESPLGMNESLRDMDESPRDTDESLREVDICKVCHQEGKPEQPLFYPCLCSGSIKYIHEECLTEWVKHSGKAYCTLCYHIYSFMPIYAPDMPSRVPITEIFAEFAHHFITVVKRWLRLIMVVILWLCILPIIVCRIRRCLHQSSFGPIMSLRLDMWSPITMLTDSFYGHSITLFILVTIFKLKFLLEKICQYIPSWLERNEPIIIKPRFYVYLPTIDEEDPAEENAEEEFQENNNEVNEENLNPNDQWNSQLIFKFLGLDGSFEFVGSLILVGIAKSLFIYVFEVLPQTFGILALKATNLQHKLSHFEEYVATFYGYCYVCITLLIMLKVATFLRCKRAQYRVGTLYIAVKVCLISALEMIVIPIAFGWFLYICSLPMFGTNLNDHLEKFHSAPYTTTIIYWLLFVVFLRYNYWYIDLTRLVIQFDISRIFEIGDREDSYLRGCMEKSIWQIGRDIIEMVLALGTAVLFTIWIPLRILKCIWPSFFPCYTKLEIDYGYSLYIIEIIFLHFVFGSISILKKKLQNRIDIAIHHWVFVVSNLLGIKLFLFKNDKPLSLQNFLSYPRPTYFVIRLIALLIMAMLSIIVINLSVIIVPVLLGNSIMPYWTKLFLFTTKLFQWLFICVRYTECFLFITWILYKVWSMEPGRRIILINQIQILAIVFFLIFFKLIVPFSLFSYMIFSKSPEDVPLFFENFSIFRIDILQIQRLILFIIVIIKIITKIICKYLQFYENVKNKRYLIDKKLVNYSRPRTV